MPFGIGPLELIIVLVIFLVIFGPKRLPQAGRSLGEGLREFKDSVTGKGRGEEDEPPPSELAPAKEPPAEAPPAATTAGRDDASRAFGRDD